MQHVTILGRKNEKRWILKLKFNFCLPLLQCNGGAGGGGGAELFFWLLSVEQVGGGTLPFFKLDN